MSDTPPPAPPAPPAPPSGDAPPPAAARPDYVPETFWDDTTKAVKPEFGAHYSELATFHKTQTEAQAALAARKPEDIKIESILPEGVKVPDGLEVKINEKDPRIPVLRELAIKNGWSQETVNALVAFDLQQQIADHTTEATRVAAEDAKLGANAKDRKGAVGNWLNGLKTAGKLSAGEAEAMTAYAVDAATVTALEKIMAMAAGSVPGAGDPPPPPNPAPQKIEDRWYGSTPQQKAS